MKLTKNDGWWLLAIVLALITGLISLWGLEMSDPISHIKFIYSALLIFGVAIFIKFVIFKDNKREKNGKRK